MRGIGAAVWLLAIGQTLTYGGVYYAFPAILPELEVATGWSKATLAMGPTLAMLLMALFIPLTGRLVDRGLGGEMLAFLPVPAASAIALMGFAQTPGQWLILWAVVGVAQAGCLYETCFAFLTYVRELFGSRGAGAGMVTLAAATIGPSQVLGRVILMMNERRIDNRAGTFAALGALVAAALALWVAGVAPWVIFLTALFQGAGVGVISIMRPVLVAEHLGREGFGAISGAIAIGPILASAAGPVVGAWLLLAGGPGLVIAACGTLGALAMLVWAGLRTRREG